MAQNGRKRQEMSLFQRGIVALRQGAGGAATRGIVHNSTQMTVSQLWTQANAGSGRASPGKEMMQHE